MSPVWILPVFLDAGNAHEIATFHIMMELGASERILFAGLAYLKPGAVPQGLRGPDGIGVETCARSDSPGARATVAEVDRRATIGMSRSNPYR